MKNQPEEQPTPQPERSKKKSHRKWWFWVFIVFAILIATFLVVWIWHNYARIDIEQNQEESIRCDTISTGYENISVKVVDGPEGATVKRRQPANMSVASYVYTDAKVLEIQVGVYVGNGHNINNITNFEVTQTRGTILSSEVFPQPENMLLGYCIAERVSFIFQYQVPDDFATGASEDTVLLNANIDGYQFGERIVVRPLANW